MLEPERVAQHEDEVTRDDQTQPPVHDEGGRKGHQTQESSGKKGRSLRKLSGCQRAVLFGWVLAV